MAKRDSLRKELLQYQKNEITEHYIYIKLAKAISDSANRKILQKIADDELRHYHILKKYTQQDVKPSILKIWKYFLISRLFGFTFGVKLMESGEEDAQQSYIALQNDIGELELLVREENKHEQELIELLDEERLQYMGSIVLGLNDALVELTGALAGFTLALRHTKLIALTGLITGIAAALSMAASEYLSIKSEETSKKPLKASIYTGTAYIATVTILIAPYLLFESLYLCLTCTLTAAVLIIAFFNYYLAVAKDLNFKVRFFEMAGLSMGVAALSFFIGMVLRRFIGVDI